MTGYTVHLATRNPAGGEAQADLPGLDQFADQLAEHSSVVTGGQNGWSAAVSVDAVDELEAIARAHSLVAVARESGGLPDWPIVRIEALTDDELDRQLEQPALPDMVSGPEAADILGVTRQRLHQLRDNPRFPEPLVDRPGAALWARSAIDRFAEAWERKPGRPPTSLSSSRHADRRPTLPAGSVSPSEVPPRARKGTTMADKKDVWTVPHGDGWANRREGNKRVSETFDTKAEAQKAGRDTARRDGVEHVILNKDGKIAGSGGKQTYPRSRDPRSSKG